MFRGFKYLLRVCQCVMNLLENINNIGWSKCKRKRCFLVHRIDNTELRPTLVILLFYQMVLYVVHK